ncbi:hypothetical protein C0Q70_08139 [Pomacea canaliculata]|uniref:Uncharacterized protein n=1 Tax=Pomacea canaliculata TaxID=400727 RepID=A0A2T7PGZ6_POMCA|nr:hypothetical protein C0Q70_08139 [Pomacea canaliculata]
MKQRFSCCTGPGYPSLLEAMRKGPREKLFMCHALVLLRIRQNRANYLATVDVDPQSPTFCQVISRLYMPYTSDEMLHHTGWNACSSCYDDQQDTRQNDNACLDGDRVYVVDMGVDPREPRLYKVVEALDIRKKTGLGSPHTSHCLGSGQVMISCIGDCDGNGGKIILALVLQPGVKKACATFYE